MRTILLITCVTFLAGCATSGAELDKELAPAADVGMSVECGNPCEKEMQRAEIWLTRHAKWKMQTATDTTLTTYNPQNADPSYGFTVTKEPVIEGDRSRIKVDMTCGNMMGCNPKEKRVRRAFLYYVKTGKDLLSGVDTGAAIK